MTPFSVQIIFRNRGKDSRPYENVVSVTVHTYGFLELAFADGSSEVMNMDEIFSFTAPTVALATATSGLAKGSGK